MSAGRSRVETVGFDELRSEWGSIYAQMPGSSVFDSPMWHEIWWEHFGGTSEMCMRAVRRGDDSLALVAPIKFDAGHDEGVATFLGGTDLVDYGGFKHDGELTDDDVALLLRDLHSDDRISAVVLESLQTDSHTLYALRRVAKDCGWELHEWDEGVAPRVTLPAHEDDYYAALTKKHRHELRRKLRRLMRAGKVERRVYANPDEVAAKMDDFMRLHRMSSVDKQQFMTLERERFFRDVAVRFAEVNTTNLTFLAVDGSEVATSLSFTVGRTRYLYNSGYDPDRSWLAVGILNHALNLFASIREGYAVYDFMRGDERYKYQLGAIDRHIVTARMDRLG